MRSLLLSILLLVVASPGALAAGVVDLYWNGCTGPIDRVVSAGQ